nr:K28 prepro-toxin [M28 virus]
MESVSSLFNIFSTIMVNYKSLVLALLSVSNLKYARGMPTSERQQGLEERDFSAATCVLMGAEVGSWGMVYSGQKVESWILYVLTGITTMSAIVDEIDYYASHMPLSVVGENSGLQIVRDTIVTLVMAGLTASANKVISKTENAENIQSRSLIPGLLSMDYNSTHTMAINLEDVFSELGWDIDTSDSSGLYKRDDNSVTLHLGDVPALGTSNTIIPNAVMQIYNNASFAFGFAPHSNGNSTGLQKRASIDDAVWLQSAYGIAYSAWIGSENVGSYDQHLAEANGMANYWTSECSKYNGVIWGDESDACGNWLASQRLDIVSHSTGNYYRDVNLCGDDEARCHDELR